MQSDNDYIFRANNQISVAIFSTIGHREEQQDAYGCLLDSEEGIVVICDGMGGLDEGSKASSIAVNSIMNAYSQKDVITDGYFCLKDVIIETNNKINAIANGTIGSTVVSLHIKGKQLYWCSAGDSRAYVYRTGKYAQITQDHNYKAVLDAKLSMDIIDYNEYNSEICYGDTLISYLGVDSLELIEYNESPISLKKGDVIILMTDGLYKILDDATIFKIIDNKNKNATKGNPAKS